MLKGRASNERKHAKRRFLERFGFPVGDDTLRGIVALIQKGAAGFHRKDSNRVTLWNVLIHGFPARVAYDKNTKEIITVMRPEDDDNDASPH